MELIAQLGITLMFAVLFLYFKRRSSNPMKTNKILKNTLNAEDRAIRASWKRSLNIMLLGNLAIGFLNHSIFANFLNMELADVFLIASVGEIISLAVGGAIIHYFGYVKFGTNWLICFLIFAPIRCTIFTIFIIKTILELEVSTIVSSYLLLAYFISLALFVNYWINNKRIYQLNHKLQKRFRSALTS